ncbi:hypothetical protein QL285_013841 [Trifolium repens]|nr:hypothetical protein QL285_013841 [Trifolium repens]
MDSSSPLLIITAGHCRRCCRCRRRHYLQPESNHHPTPPIHSTEKIDGFVKPGGWNEFYIARGRTCSETVSKQGEANDGNCNNGYCSGCSSSIAYTFGLNIIESASGYIPSLLYNSQNETFEDAKPEIEALKHKGVLAI